MGFFGNLFKSEFEKWVEGASHEELSEAYEEERQDWIKNGFNGGTGEKTPKMNRLNVLLIYQLNISKKYLKSSEKCGIINIWKKN